MSIKLRKSEDDKRFETRSKIRGYKAQVDRNLKKQQQLLNQAINNLKSAAAIKDNRGVLNAAQNAKRIKSAIDYLRSFSLYLDNLEITFEFVYNEREINRTLSEAHTDLGKRMLTDEQAREIENNLRSINESTENLETRLEEQFSTLGESLQEFASRGGVSAEDIVKEVTGQSVQAMESSQKSSEAAGDKEIDDLIKKITGEKQKS
ncbi:MAG: hypothetical protein M1533_03295 [Candidatus Thermoplasmatota archaeon]|jgi:hypothetical protein|nr:hypothetical protein [Candidatus Thermoplasmatota archaeon]MCL5794080.1 hypothetical protein [Candidatus Thermoplasmatota archaeon]